VVDGAGVSLLISTKQIKLFKTCMGTIRNVHNAQRWKHKQPSRFLSQTCTKTREPSVAFSLTHMHEYRGTQCVLIHTCTKTGKPSVAFSLTHMHKDRETFGCVFSDTHAHRQGVTVRANTHVHKDRGT